MKYSELNPKQKLAYNNMSDMLMKIGKNDMIKAIECFLLQRLKIIMTGGLKNDTKS